MNWAEIKNMALEKVKGNKWDILWPVLIIWLIISILESSFMPKIDMQSTKLTFEVFGSVSVISFIITIIEGILMAGYTKYILNFIRTGKFDYMQIIDCIKDKWLELLIAVSLTSVLIGIGFAFFIIPGIILGLAYSFVCYIIIDTDTPGIDAMKKSREMMKGYKWDLFMFFLSFIGWIILSIFTFFILWIWLFPYMTIAFALYYEKLKEIKG